MEVGTAVASTTGRLVGNYLQGQYSNDQDKFQKDVVRESISLTSKTVESGIKAVSRKYVKMNNPSAKLGKVKKGIIGTVFSTV